MYFFISVVVLLSSFWFFFVFSLSFVKTYCCIHPFFSWVHWTSVTSLPLTLCWVDCLSYIFFIWIYTSLTSFCPIFFYFFILSSLKLWFLILEKWPCVGDVLWGSAEHSLYHWSHMLLSCPMSRLCEPFSCGMASYCGHAGWQGWPLAKVAASTASCIGCFPTGGWGWIPA